jgi:hypothetical protein
MLHWSELSMREFHLSHTGSKHFLWYLLYLFDLRLKFFADKSTSINIWHFIVKYIFVLINELLHFWLGNVAFIGSAVMTLSIFCHLNILLFEFSWAYDPSMLWRLYHRLDLLLLVLRQLLLDHGCFTILIGIFKNTNVSRMIFIFRYVNFHDAFLCQYWKFFNIFLCNQRKLQLIRLLYRLW